MVLLVDLAITMRTEVSRAHVPFRNVMNAPFPTRPWMWAPQAPRPVCQILLACGDSIAPGETSSARVNLSQATNPCARTSQQRISVRSSDINDH